MAANRISAGPGVDGASAAGTMAAMRASAHPGRRRASYCPHGRRRISCGERHKEDDTCLGEPFCPLARM
jgi:hypothetical protein